MSQYQALNKEVHLLKLFFQGRKDVFAIHWQKGNKSGYMPSYHFETLSKVLIHDSARNKLILEDILEELRQENKVVIITERKGYVIWKDLLEERMI